MGRVSRWINVGENIFDTLDEMSKLTRAVDAAALRKAVETELETNYKHIEKKQQLMQKMGDTLESVILPMVNNNENNPEYIAFNAAGEQLCDNDLRF